MKERGINVLSEIEAARQPLRVIIQQSTLQKIKCYVDLCDYEINGLGMVERSGNDFLIVDAFILDQITAANGMRVKMDSQAQHQLLFKMAQNGGDPSQIKLQWHSHVNDPVFFSSEDIATIAGYMNDFMISLVMNKQGEYRCRLDLFQPFYLGLEVPLEIRLLPPSDIIVNQCREEIGRCVKVAAFGGWVQRRVSVPESRGAVPIIVPAEAAEEDHESLKAD